MSMKNVVDGFFERVYGVLDASEDGLGLVIELVVETHALILDKLDEVGGKESETPHAPNKVHDLVEYFYGPMFDKEATGPTQLIKHLSMLSESEVDRLWAQYVEAKK